MRVEDARLVGLTNPSIPVSRLAKDRRVPSHKDGGRVLYHRGDLDEYVLGLGRVA